MTRGPRRLVDDPDFKWETGCNLADEQLVVGEYDHERVKSRLIAAVALLPSAGSAEGAVSVGDGLPTIKTGSAPGWAGALVRPVLGALGGAVVVAGAYWLGVRAGTDVETQMQPEPAPIVAPLPGEGLDIELPPPPRGGTDEAPPSDAAPGTAPADVRASAPVAPTALPAKAQPSTPGGDDGSDGVASAQPEAVPSAVEAPGTAEAPAGEGTAPSRTEATSRMGAELAAYGVARDALLDEHYAEAARAFEAYLRQYPSGTMRAEAQIGRLEAVRGMGDVEALASLTAKLQDLPELSGRRQEILRLRAESLVHSDRCDEALLVAEELPTRIAGEIRKACRASRRE